MKTDLHLLSLFQNIAALHRIIIFNTKFIIFNAKSIIFNAKSIIFNTNLAALSKVLRERRLQSSSFLMQNSSLWIQNSSVFDTKFILLTHIGARGHDSSRLSIIAPEIRPSATCNRARDLSSAGMNIQSRERPIKRRHEYTKQSESICTYAFKLGPSLFYRAHRVLDHDRLPIIYIYLMLIKYLLLIN